MSPRDNYIRIAPGISAAVMPVTHGACAQSPDGTYESSAWFLRNDSTSKEFLFFGDVEPDSISHKPQNRLVWKTAASKICAGVLDTIFLECSYRSDQKTSELFGHLSPPHVLDELRNLATEIKTYGKSSRLAVRPSASFLSVILGYLGLGRRVSEPPPPTPALPDSELGGVLKGLRLVVIHCKAVSERFPEDASIADVISGEIRALTDEAGFGVSIVAAKQGTTIGE